MANSTTATHQLAQSLKKKNLISNIIIAVVVLLLLVGIIFLAFRNHYVHLYYAVNADGVTYTYKAPKTNNSHVEVPTKIKGSPIKDLGVWSYSNSKNLVEITIPEGYESIGRSAFENCEALNKISIPSTVKSIGVGAFYNTAYYNNQSNWIDNALYVSGWLIAVKESESELLTINVKDGTVGIADGVFKDRKDIKSVTLPDSVKYLGYETFYECTGLTDIIIGDGVEAIGDRSFYGCMNLTDVVIGEKVSKIGNYTFQECLNLTSVTFKDPTTWYFTLNSAYTEGTPLGMDDPYENAVYLMDSFQYCFWYKI
ncbi:MAG: leucine-rich repeat domain-containing protein [Clostridia bacterium]|nr:leucine-rich repeat domain-containing protein [Clostridia bacterium]